MMRRFFHFHLATLLVAALLASGVLYLNLRNMREPFVYSGFALRTGSTRYVMLKDGRCIKERGETQTYHYLTRVYLENPGWPYPLWNNSLSVTTIDIPRGERETFSVLGVEWEKAKLPAAEHVVPFLYRDEDIAQLAPHFQAKIFSPKEPHVMWLPEWPLNEILKNAGVGLLLVLLPSIALEVFLRRRDCDVCAS
jgi:hypothetical protein